MAPEREHVLGALRGVRYPGFSRDIVSFGIVRRIEIEGDRVRIEIDLGAGNPAVSDPIRTEAAAAVERLPGVASVEVSISGRTGTGPTVAAGLAADLLPGVRHVVAVASGKGGVGKSTVAVNLAIALAESGATVGLLDADIYGPSIPLMMGVSEQPRLEAGERRILPFERHGVRFMSLGFLVDRDTAVIWRGPMVMKAVEQLLRDVAWGPLDVLVVDMPPGTGDAQLTLSQRVRLSGAVIVTTPQDIALVDAIKGASMFRRVGVPVMGIVENMSHFSCPHCGERTDVFGHGGGRREADRLAVPFLGEIPLDPEIRTGGDSGTPITTFRKDSPVTASFRTIADRVLRALRSSSQSGEGSGILDASHGQRAKRDR